MSDGQLAWGEAEWSRIRQIVHDEAMRARVAGSFLPLYGPLPDSTESLPVNQLSLSPAEGGRAQVTLRLNDHETKRLASVSVNVALKNHMVADPHLEAATILFRRAATIVAKVEDEIVFNGKRAGKLGEGAKRIDPIFTSGGDDAYLGLTDCAGTEIGMDAKLYAAGPGQAVFRTLVEAVTRLEANGYHRPFAVVLGQDFFTDLHTPLASSMVLPRDSVPPVTEGPLVRAPNLAPKSGMVISLQGEPVEIVVPKDISVRYLQAGLDGEHVFRVSQRFLLRVKDNRAIAKFGL